jgi:hypothetical protein
MLISTSAGTAGRSAPADGEMMFHHDMIHAEIPSKATLLYSVEILRGGNALFASGCAAILLDPAVRNQLETARRCIITTTAPRREATAEHRGLGECMHPVFRTNEDTGGKTSMSIG